MSYSKIIIRYAAAYFDLANDRGLLDVAHSDMDTLNRVCKSNPDFIRMLRNPVIAAEKKKIIINKIFSGQVNTDTLLFMQLMVRKHREKYLPEIADAFIELYLEWKGYKTVRVTSAVALDETEKNGVLTIAGKLTHKKINLVENTDKNLIGGFVINVDDYQVDQSLATKIKELKKDFEQNLFIKGF